MSDTTPLSFIVRFLTACTLSAIIILSITGLILYEVGAVQ